jgi:protein gp37
LPTTHSLTGRRLETNAVEPVTKASLGAVMQSMAMEVWNPTTGCDRISPGCDNCYALRIAPGLKTNGNPDYQHDGDPRTSGPGFGLTLHEHALAEPGTWDGPRFVAVNTMSDLFHEQVPLAFIERIFAVMSETPQHLYQVLTKRSRRLIRLAPDLMWPGNVCMGVSVENDRYSYRADDLRRIPAAFRFLQLEPLLGPLPSLDVSGIDWVVAGRESGPGARPMDPLWLDAVRERCRDHGVLFMVGSPARSPVRDQPAAGPGKMKR